MLLRPEHANPTPLISTLHQIPTSPSLCFLSTALLGPTRPKLVDIGAWARQLQTCRLWTYALTFSCIAGFDVIVLNSTSSSSTASSGSAASSSKVASSSRLPRQRWSSSSPISDHDDSLTSYRPVPRSINFELAWRPAWAGCQAIPWAGVG